MASPQPNGIRIVRWMEQAAGHALVPGIEAVFFASAGTHAFADAGARASFRERWLGRYLASDPAHVWLALSTDGAVAGYLVGCLEDPARTARFTDISYFATLAGITKRYPAHLHINLDARWRGAGVGSRLVSAFCTDAARRGAEGVHVVTGAGMRNVGFYARNGFSEVARTTWNGREIVMLARPLLVL